MQKKNRRSFLKNTVLSTLGLSLIPQLSKAEKIVAQPDSCDETTEDFYGEGPFYTANPPTISNNQLAGINEPGTKLIISGRIFNLDCTQWLPNVVVDVWHADDAGAYDNVGYNLRGQTLSNSQGFYIFETIQPGRYLNGPTYRPSHIHFKVTAPGMATLTTQLYFQGDPYIAGDSAASINSGVYDASDRIIPLANNNGTLEGTFDLIVSGSGIINNTSELHLEKGMIYSASPNPFSNELRINYGVFKTAKVSIAVFDVQGRTVAVLEESTMTPEKYESIWHPEDSLPTGHYFVTLKVNDLQVHYIKILRQR